MDIFVQGRNALRGSTGALLGTTPASEEKEQHSLKEGVCSFRFASVDQDVLQLERLTRTVEPFARVSSVVLLMTRMWY